MIQGFKKLSFGKKILSSYILFIGISFLLLGVYCLKSIETSKEESCNYMHQFTEQVNLNLDVIFSNMDRMRFIHLIDDQIKPIIRSEEEKKSLAQQLEDDDYITKAMNHMTNMNQYVLRATIVNEYGDVYSNLKTENKEYLKYIRQIEEKQNWSDKNKIFYTGVYQEQINMVQYSIVTSVSKIYDIDRDEPLGTLYIDLNFSAVEKILDDTLKLQNTGTYLMLFDKDEDLIYRTGRKKDLWGEMTEADKEELLKTIRKDGKRETESAEISVGGKKSAVSIMENKGTGWNVLVYTPLSHIYALSWKNMVGIVTIMILVLVIAMFLGIFLSRQISRPVRVLIKAMDKVEQGKVKCIDESEYDWQDEMGYLLRSYNQMGRRINESIEKIYVYQLNQKQTELKMLQFQINPHFLYNTLNTISSIASLEGITEIAQIADNLSNMFQYNIKGSEIVPLKMEIQHVQNYLGIQTIRFPGKYEFSYDIDPRLYEEPMLKFLLQPLVENSLQHAFERMKKINRISLVIKSEGEDIGICIRDNGIGMPKEKAQELNRELKQTDTLTLVTNVDKGIGLRNVNARIKNFYGKEYGIQIETYPEEYTMIRIMIRKIPKSVWEADHVQDGSSR